MSIDAPIAEFSNRRCLPPVSVGTYLFKPKIAFFNTDICALSNNPIENRKD